MDVAGERGQRSRRVDGQDLPPLLQLRHAPGTSCRTTPCKARRARLPHREYATYRTHSPCHSPDFDDVVEIERKKPCERTQTKRLPLRICQICHSFKDAPAPSAKAASTISFQTESESLGAALAFIGPWISHWIGSLHSGCNTGYKAQRGNVLSSI